MEEMPALLRSADFTQGCWTLKAWGRDGLCKTHVSPVGRTKPLVGCGQAADCGKTSQSGVGSWRPPKCWMPSL